MNIAMLLSMAADGFPDRVAIGDRTDGLTFAQWRRLADGGAALLGSTPGVLATLAPNGIFPAVGLFAAATAGWTYAPLNYRLPETARKELLATIDPAVVVGPEAEDVDDWVARAGDRAAALTGAEFEPADDPRAVAVMLFTSGTSSAPKAALLRHEALFNYIVNTTEFGSAEEGEASLVCVPPFHVAGVAALLSACYTGRRLVPMPSFSPELWLTTAREQQVTHAMVVPTMLARIVNALPPGGPDLPHLRSIAYGGARMPAPVLERALEAFPEVNFVNAYGLTETSSTICVLGPDDHRAAIASDDPAVRARLASVGRPVPGIEIIVVGESGEPVVGDAPGEIWVRGGQVAGEYLTQGSRLDEASWLKTGDVGRLDPDGYLFLEGRLDDMIISGGENISPTEVEDMLLRHPAVAAAAAVGIPDADWGERVGAAVTLREGEDISAADLRAWLAERIGSLKTPREIALWPELPLTPTGKVVRREVRAALLAD
ncbi:MAG: class I adenylate-forming enzyme family protein [Frankia sp.]